MPKLPDALPHGERTIGQTVAESMRAYGNDFWRILPLGLPLAIADQLGGHSAGVQTAVYWLLTPLFVAAYVWACSLLLDATPTRAAWIVAVLVYLPFPILRALYILPGLAWFAFIGLAVPAAMLEGLPVRRALARGRELGLASLGHALGSLSALVIVVGLAAQALQVILQGQSDAGLRLAVFVSDMALSPLLFVGGALLYRDQAARVRTAGADLADAPLES